MISASTGIFIIAFFMSSSAIAQSFDCHKADRPDELAICEDEQLARLDQRMARLYSQMRAAATQSERREIERAQLNWIKARRECRKEQQCINRLYHSRIAELEAAFRKNDQVSEQHEPSDQRTAEKQSGETGEANDEAQGFALTCFHKGWGVNILFSFDLASKKVREFSDGRTSIWEIRRITDAEITARFQAPLEPPEDSKYGPLDRRTTLITVNRYTGEMSEDQFDDSQELRAIHKVVPTKNQFYRMPCRKTKLEKLF